MKMLLTVALATELAHDADDKPVPASIEALATLARADKDALPVRGRRDGLRLMR
jgi:hypothetical protein